MPLFFPLMPTGWEAVQIWETHPSQLLAALPFGGGLEQAWATGNLAKIRSRGLILLRRSNSTKTVIDRPNLEHLSMSWARPPAHLPPQQITFPFIRSAWEQFSYNLQYEFISQTSDASLCILARSGNISELTSPICIQGLIIPHINIRCPKHLLMVLIYLQQVELITMIKRSWWLCTYVPGTKSVYIHVLVYPHNTSTEKVFHYFHFKDQETEIK